jgi:hypothetical protein
MAIKELTTFTGTLPTLLLGFTMIAQSKRKLLLMIGGDQASPVTMVASTLVMIASIQVTHNNSPLLIENLFNLCCPRTNQLDWDQESFCHTNGKTV